MTAVGLAWTDPGYAGLRAPWHPGEDHPELRGLLGETATASRPNAAYSAVRRSLWALGLDAERFGSEAWNPLGVLVSPGDSVVLKPNFIRHWNPCPSGSMESVVTHGSVIRAMADYAALAVGSAGSVVLAEAPQQDCGWEAVAAQAGLREMAQLHASRGRTLECIDLRREAVETEDGVIVERHTLPGDPSGYRAVDLGERSFFTGSGLDPSRMRGADYDPAVTTEHHSGGRNAYLLSETVLRADLIVNLPKLKTHKKTGVTLALKNLVGINGDKNWLPHHCVGGLEAGGDEYPRDDWPSRARSRAIEWLRPHLARGRFLTPLRAARRAEWAVRGDDFIRSGNWHGNRTTWRMCADLNRALYYSDSQGLDLGADAPRRTVLSVLDGIVAGEGEGPLAPTDRPLGAVIASLDPVAADLVALRLMGFDEACIPKICDVMRDDFGPRITRIRTPDDVALFVSRDDATPREPVALDALPCDAPFLPHPGWKGQIERRSS